MKKTILIIIGVLVIMIAIAWIVLQSSEEIEEFEEMIPEEEEIVTKEYEGTIPEEEIIIEGLEETEEQREIEETGPITPKENVKEIDCLITYEAETAECYAKIAIETANYIFCEELREKGAPGWIPTCYANIAVLKLNKEICDLIDENTWPSFMNQCYSMVEANEVFPWMVE